MTLQQKIFRAGLSLTPEELAALALAEAQLREKARAGESGSQTLRIIEDDEAENLE